MVINNGFEFELMISFVTSWHSYNVIDGLVYVVIDKMSEFYPIGTIIGVNCIPIGLKDEGVIVNIFDVLT